MPVTSASIQKALQELIDASRPNGDGAREVLETTQLVSADEGWLRRVREEAGGGLSAEAAVHRDNTGDIALTLRPGNRMPYLKLWPHARAWRLSQPQPMLRVIPQAAVVAGLLVRALQTAEHKRAVVTTRPAPAFQPMPAPAEAAA